MVAAGPVGANGAAVDGAACVLHQPRPLAAAGVEAQRHVALVCDRQAAVDGRRCGSRAALEREGAGAGADLRFDRLRGVGLARAEEPQVHRQPFRRLEHPCQMEGTGGAGGGMAAGGWAGAAPHQGGDAAGQGGVDLLRADERDVGVDAAGGEDASLAGDDFGAGTHHDGPPRLSVRVARLADGHDAAVP